LSDGRKKYIEMFGYFTEPFRFKMCVLVGPITVNRQSWIEQRNFNHSYLIISSFSPFFTVRRYA